MKKIKKKDSQAFTKAMAEFLETYGKRAALDRMYLLDTKLGTLSVYVDICHFYCYSLCTRFLDIDTLDKSSLPLGANEFNGKWNFHLGNSESYWEEIADVITSRLKTVLAQ